MCFLSRAIRLRLRLGRSRRSHLGDERGAAFLRATRGGRRLPVAERRAARDGVASRGFRTGGVPTATRGVLLASLGRGVGRGVAFDDAEDAHGAKRASFRRGAALRLGHEEPSASSRGVALRARVVLGVVEAVARGVTEVSKGDGVLAALADASEAVVELARTSVELILKTRRARIQLGDGASVAVRERGGDDRQATDELAVRLQALLVLARYVAEVPDGFAPLVVDVRGEARHRDAFVPVSAVPTSRREPRCHPRRVQARGSPTAHRCDRARRGVRTHIA